MSYNVSHTMLFDDLTESEAAALKREIEDLVIIGISASGSPAFEAWWKATHAHLPDTNRLLIMATVYPARALLSLLKMQK